MAALALSLLALASKTFAYEETLVGGEVKVIAGIETVLRVDLQDNVGIKIEPGSKEPYVVPISLGIYTNNPAGYLSYITTNVNRNNSSDNLATALRHNSVSQVIDSLTAEVPFSNFPAGYWGYSIDGGKNFNGVPAANETPVQVNTDAGLSFAVKVPDQQPSGVYSNTIVVSVVTRHVQSESELFSGITYMQDMTQEICETENAGLSKQLIDRRDGKVYWVTKMKDNSCWMTQNLDFEISTSGTTITPADTDVFSTKTLTADSVVSDTSILYLDGGDYYVPHGDYYPDNSSESRFFPTSELASNSTEWHYQVGSFYSWPAATAGSGTADVLMAEADESICPQGWRLPIYSWPILEDRDYSFTKLYNAQPEIYHHSTNTGLTYHVDSMGTAPFYYVDMSGLFTDQPSDDFYTISHSGGWNHFNATYNSNAGMVLWSATANPLGLVGDSWNGALNTYLGYYDSTDALGILTGAKGTGSSDYGVVGPPWGSSSWYSNAGQAFDRSSGASIRCVSKKNDLYSISTMQEVTDEIVKNTGIEATKRLTDTRDGKKYWVTKMYDGNLWMTQNLAFNISSSGTTLYPATSDVLTTKTITATATHGSDYDGIYYYDEGNIAYRAYEYHYESGKLVVDTNNEKISFDPNQQSTQGHYEVGSYYSWYAATAGSAADAVKAGDDAQESICPKGWHLPSNNGNNGVKDVSYDKMMATFLEQNTYISDTYYGTSGGKTRDEYRYYLANYPFEASPIYLFKSGVVDDSGNISGEYEIGAYWSSGLKSRNSNDVYAYQLRIGNDNIRSRYRPSDEAAEKSNYGAKVRCVAVGRDPYTVVFDANGGIGGPTTQSGSSMSRDFTVTLSSLEPAKSGLTFAGWSTDPDAVTAMYQPGETITFSQSPLNLYAVWGPSTIITFDANGGTGSMTDQNIPSGNTRNLRTNEFTKTNYSFAGWSTNPDAVIAEYLNKAEYTSAYVDSNINVTLYAVWMVTLQSFSCDSLLNIGDEITLPDTRDGQMYKVRKEEDGRCWTRTNMRLDFTHLLEDISAANTNNPTNEFVNAARMRPAGSSAWCSDFSTDCNNKILYNTVNIGDHTVGGMGTDFLEYDEYGVYYNYYTATAGNAKHETIKNLGIVGDLCPYGWHLPTGNPGGEMDTLYVSNNSDSDYTIAGFKKSGYYYGSSVSTRGYAPFYWAAGDATSAGLGTYYSGGHADGRTWPQNYGSTIRCVANYDQEFTIVYNANGGEGAPASQTETSNKGKKEIALSSTIPTRANYDFAGWSTDPNAAIGEYEAGQNFVAAKPSTELYAIWVVNMQGFDCSRLTNVGDSIILTDRRDDVAYKVAKLADGHCWMTQDLMLSFGKLKQNISAANTNNPTSDFMSMANANETWSWCAYSGSYCYDRPNIYTRNVWNSGAYTYFYYYNYWTATAGNGTYDFSYGSTTGDICPYGWHLPTGNNTGEYANLMNALGGYNINGVAQYMDSSTTPPAGAIVGALASSPYNFVIGSGYVWNGTVYTGGESTYWTSTTFNQMHAYRFSFGSGYIYPGTSYNNKFHGHSVRCIANY